MHPNLTEEQVTAAMVCALLARLAWLSSGGVLGQGPALAFKAKMGVAPSRPLPYCEWLRACAYVEEDVFARQCLWALEWCLFYTNGVEDFLEEYLSEIARRVASGL